MVTTTANIQSETMKYASQDGTQIEAYLSQPATPGRYPGVIVTMEGMGLEDHMKDLTRQTPSSFGVSIRAWKARS